jgi:tRNA-dihydrouridine synthase A
VKTLMKKFMKNTAPLFSVAPMLDWTDKHCRYFLRLISQKAYLYTEMITTGAILNGDVHRQLAFNPFEKPVALQLGGSDPQSLAACAKYGENYGYDEINLNVGCPSPRVQKGRFGVCLMKEPQLVAECVSQMKAAVNIPVTVKTRIGVDEEDSYAHLHHFIGTVAEAGCETFIIHARKAWLKGLSPKENREIPPLRYDMAEQISRDFPASDFILNGGIQSVEDVQKYFGTFSGIMLGRAVYHSPYDILSRVDEKFYKVKEKPASREEVLENYTDYARGQRTTGVPPSLLARPLMGLYQGMAGAKKWRRELGQFFKKVIG